MQYDGETETFEINCSAHCPMPMKTELKQSLDEQVTDILEFTQAYKETLLKAKNQILHWTDGDKTKLLRRVAETFFAFLDKGPVLFQSVQEDATSDKTPARDESSVHTKLNQHRKNSCKAEDSLDKEWTSGLLPGNADWRISLILDEFPWKQVAFNNFDKFECWK